MTPSAAWTLRRAWPSFGGLLTLVIVFAVGAISSPQINKSVLRRELQYLLHS